MKRGSEWGHHNRMTQGLKAILIYISGEAHAKLNRRAYLEERTLQKVGRRIIEESVKDVGLPEKGKGGNPYPSD